MIKKEKIFELKIQEDDDVSGIDSISLVDEPAIEVNWVAFKKEVQEDFHIPNGEDDTYLGKLLSKGQPEQELLDEGWEIDRIESVKENFATTPNDVSSQDNSFYRVRYKYSLNRNIKQSAIIPTTRQFCKELISRNYVWRIEEIENEINSFGQSAQFWRGGYNCRHEWFRIFYKKTGDIINKSSINKGKITDGEFPIELSPEWLQPNTVTDKTASNPKPSTIKNLGLRTDFDGKPKVSLDYDGVLSTPQGLELYKELIDSGNEVYIVSARNESEGKDILDKAKLLRIPQSKVLFTNGAAKSDVLNRIGITKHYDNNIDVINEIKKNAPSVSAIKFEKGVPHYTEDGKLYEGPTHISNGRLMTGAVHTKDSVYLYHADELDIEPNPCWEGYEPIGLKDDGSPNCVPIKMNMESVSDYPDSVKNNAKAVLKYVEENGWGSCGTDVGKQRANQLAKGESISLETVKRMYNYLSRHKVDLDSSKGYGDGCGKLMYDSWGGLSALSWAKSKLNDFGYDVGGLPPYVDQLPKKKKKKSYIEEFEYLFASDMIKCENCGWEWNLKDGGNDPYVCHKCGTHNAPQNMSKQHFATDNEKHIVLGPAMIPDQKIFRKDSEGNPYYVYFSSDTIKMIAEKYMRNKYTDNNDTMHDGKAIKDIHVLESWIKEDSQDKSNKYGFESLPVGTWFVSMKVNNPKVWEEVKQGKLNGFSVSGFFEEVAQFSREEMFLYKVAEVLKNIKE
jgi:hypothetical protein